MKGPEPRFIWWVTATLTVTIGLQVLRVFVATTNFYLVDAREAHPVIGGTLALVVFAVGSGFPLVIRSMRGRRRSSVASAAVLGGARLVEQLTRSPGVDLVIAALGVSAFLFLLSNLVRGWSYPTGLGLLAGISLDVALMGAAWTLDLSWVHGFIPLAVVALFAGMLIVGAMLIPTGTIHGGSSRFALVVGPWLALQMIVFGNLAWVGSVTGLSHPTTWMLAAAATAVGLIVAVRAEPGRWWMGGTGIVLMGTTAWLGLSTGPFLAPVYFAGQVSAAVLLIGALRRRDPAGAPGAGFLAMVALLFLHYAGYEFSLGFRSTAILIVTAGAVSLAGVVAAGRPERPEPAGAPVYGAVGLVVPALVVWLVWSPPGFVQPEELDGVRVMSYNVHQGFNTAGVLDLKAIARVIDSEGADIVALQEISRGWVVAGSLDMLAWLSDRLGMPFTSGPTADGQWGNAVLSRYPILSSGNVPLPTRDLPLRRGYLDVTIDTGARPLRILATHLHHVSGEEEVRVAQARALVSAWDLSPRTVLLGDLNATPDSRPLRVLLEAGLSDAAFADGIRRPTSPAHDPRRTIDYVLISPDLGASRVSVAGSEASDHLPVTVTVDWSE